MDPTPNAEWLEDEKRRLRFCGLSEAEAHELAHAEWQRQMLGGAA